MDQDTCTVDGCEQPVKVKKRGLCGAHYQRWHSYGDPLGGPMATRASLPRVCTVEGCDAPVLARGWCSPHYQRWKNYGDPQGKSTKPFVPKYKGESPDWVREQVATRPRTDGCWTDGGFSQHPDGYPLVGGVKVGYIAMEADGRPRPTGTYQLHSCDNPPCWAPHHLRWGTPQENVDDREERGRGVRNQGEAHGAAVLTDDDVRWIRATYEAGKHLPQRHPDRVTIRQMAAKLNVSTRPVHSVIKGYGWAHVK